MGGLEVQAAIVAAFELVEQLLRLRQLGFDSGPLGGGQAFEGVRSGLSRSAAPLACLRS